MKGDGPRPLTLSESVCVCICECVWWHMFRGLRGCHKTTSRVSCPWDWIQGVVAAHLPSPSYCLALGFPEYLKLRAFLFLIFYRETEESAPQLPWSVHHAPAGHWWCCEGPQGEVHVHSTADHWAFAQVPRCSSGGPQWTRVQIPGENTWLDSWFQIFKLSKVNCVDKKPLSRAQSFCSRTIQLSSSILPPKQTCLSTLLPWQWGTWPHSRSK